MNVHDVAKYFLSKVDEDLGDGISNLKLQKLVYYAQGFYLAIHDEPLFANRIEAWEHGPVVPDLYHAYKAYGGGNIPVPADFDAEALDGGVTELLDEVYSVFGQYSAWKLRNMTHEERPWKEAFREPGRERVISQASLREYFSDYVTG